MDFEFSSRKELPKPLITVEKVVSKISGQGTAEVQNWNNSGDEEVNFEKTMQMAYRQRLKSTNNDNAVIELKKYVSFKGKYELYKGCRLIYDNIRSMFKREFE